MVDTVRVYDTATVFVRDTVLQVPGTVEVLRDAQDFYSESFNQLLVVFSVLFGLVGVLVPLLIAFLQWLQARKQHNAIEKQKERLIAFEREIDIQIRGALHNMDQRVQDVERSALNKFEDLRKLTSKRIGQLWMTSAANQTNYSSKAGCYYIAFVAFLEAESAGNLERVIHKLAQTDLNNEAFGDFSGPQKQLLDISSMDAKVRALIANTRTLAEWDKLLEKVAAVKERWFGGS